MKDFGSTGVVEQHKFSSWVGISGFVPQTFFWLSFLFPKKAKGLPGFPVEEQGGFTAPVVVAVNSGGLETCGCCCPWEGQHPAPAHQPCWITQGRKKFDF